MSKSVAIHHSSGVEVSRRPQHFMQETLVISTPLNDRLAVGVECTHSPQVEKNEY